MKRFQLLLLPLALVGAAPPTDGKIGTWDLDIAASRLLTPAPRVDIRQYEEAGDGMVRSTHSVVDAGGKESVTIYTARDDGRPYPMRNAAGADLGTIALTRRDRFNQDFVTMRAGQETGRGRTTLSRDGRRMTMRITVRIGSDRREMVTVFRRRATP